MSAVATVPTAARNTSTPKRRRSLADYLRAGEKAQHDGLAIGAYYAAATEEEHEAGPLLYIDPILMIFVGKFGTDILKSIFAERRVNFDDGWDRGRVWEYHQIAERLTKAVNGGVWEFHQRLNQYPKLWEKLQSLGFKHPGYVDPIVRRYPSSFVSVFRAITYMSDVRHMSVEEIAKVLEDTM